MDKHVCPWWVGYLLLIPFRRFPHNPEKILGPHVKKGMIVLDVGPGMGFFSLPLARMVGASGKILCVDLQERMLETLKKRARKAGLSNIIEARLCSQDSLILDDLAGKIDFALAFGVVHEIPDRDRLFREIHECMKQGSRLLFAEPKIHVKRKNFEESLAIAQQAGFEIFDHPKIKRTHAVLLYKKG